MSADTAATNETTPPPQPLDEWFLSLLACPGCSQHLPLHLSDSKDALLCKCGRYSFPIREDGLPVIIMEEATLLNENAHPEDVTG